MELSQLIGQNITDDFALERIVDDSRSVQAGDVFVLDIKVCPTGGEKFIDDALAKGARAVITNVEMPAQSKVYSHEDPGLLLSRFAADKFPHQVENIVGITGTNGKTSVAWFYEQLLHHAGYKAASVGTLGVSYDGTVESTGYTSPTAPQAHHIISGLAAKNVSHVAMEVSSHALDQHRLDGFKFKAAAFTNITPDHRDYHGSMEAYLLAKQRLFSELLPEGATAVLNITRPESWPMAAICKERGINVLTFGTYNAELVVKPTADAQGMQVDVLYGENKFKTHLPLFGQFQADNLAAALGLAVATGVEWNALMAALPHIKSAVGRMEVILSEKGGNKPTVVVDYAHTPDALEKVIKALRGQTSQKLFVLFGCGGDRDAGKRPMMGKIAADLADVALVTDDNPRHEDAGKIRQEVLAASSKLQECADRAEAIKHLVHQAQEGDIVLLAGKGHETGQIVGDEVLPFDDRAIAQQVLESL